MRRYYEIRVASQRYRQQAPLTYQSHHKLTSGALVIVPLQQQKVVGIVGQEVKQPTFTTKNVLEYLELPPLPVANLTLLEWMMSYYPAPLGPTVQLFLPKRLSNNLLGRNLSEKIKYTAVTLPPLTNEQEAAVNAIRKGSGTYLLHGETGSGKTRVYQELIIDMLAKQRSVIVLTPEISLTTQLVTSLRSMSATPVLVLHSQLTEAERRKVWTNILTTSEPVVVVGARSALFAPIHDLGLIIIDEAHEPAYKQEQSPYYQTLRVASKLAQLTNSKLILGSATPNIADYYWAEQKRAPILRMKELALKTSDGIAATVLIDLKDRTQFTCSGYISDTLIKAMAEALANQEQTLLFLNRRGSARVMLCQACGWQALCPNCDLPLIYHGDSHTLRCHLCNYHQAAFAVCPICNSTEIIFKGIGTKALINEVGRLFPKARIQRFDTDNKKTERFEQHYEHVVKGDIDILVGTQSIAKGLDLPKLSVVGIITADTSLYTPDYTAAERLYQLMSQVIGRVGRGHRAGQAIIQTHNPDNPILKAALTKDWPSFYKLELKEREQFIFPPFCHLLKLTIRRATNASAQKASEQLITLLNHQKLKVKITGPAPAFHEKVAQQFEWQIVIKAKQRGELLKIIKLLPSGWSYDIDPINLL